MPFAPQQSTRPLSEEEINGLRVNMVLPVAFIAAIGIVALLMTLGIVIPNWERPFIKTFFGMAALLLLAVAIAVWMHVRNNAGDLRDRVAQVRSGKVLSKRQTGRAPYTFYATIEGTGELIVWGADYDRMTEQATYTVAFSPRTRRVWTVEPVAAPLTEFSRP